MKLSKSVTQLVGALLLGAACGVQAFPDKAVRIIVPFSAGTITDVLAREVGQLLAEDWKQPVVVENRTGAEGAIGVKGLLSSAPDGHTILFASNSISVLEPLLKLKLAYDPVKDFKPVCTVARIDNILNMSSKHSYENIQAFLKEAKAQPGKFTFAYSSATLRLAGELFSQTSGVQLMGVPYSSTAMALSDVASGEVDMIFIDQASAGPFYQTEKIRPMVIAGTQGLKSLPNVSTAVEAGVPGYEIYPWFAFYASAGTPEPLVEKLREAVARTLETEGMAKLLNRTNLQEFSICGDDLTRQIAQDSERMAKVIETANIPKQ